MLLSFPGAAGVSLGSKEETRVEVGSPAIELYCRHGGLSLSGMCCKGTTLVQALWCSGLWPLCSTVGQVVLLGG